MTFAAAERAYLTHPEDSCGGVGCDDGPCTCRERDEQGREDDAIDRADSIRKGEL